MKLLECFPEPRMRPYLDAARGDHRRALELYSWNARMAGAALEQLSHLEVLLRHAVDAELANLEQEKRRGIPWFLLSPYDSAQEQAVEKVRERLRRSQRETRDQIIAGLSFGYWTGWFGSKYEELWRKSLHRAFPNSSGNRKEVSAKVEQIRKFRNRIAHHDSLLNVDVGFEMSAVFKLAEMISQDAAAWMKTVDRTKEVGRQRPISVEDTVVVPAGEAWSLYQHAGAYVCQAGRFFREVRHIAFYVDRKIKREVPQLKVRRDAVRWNMAEARRLKSSPNKEDRKIGNVIEESIKRGWPSGTFQVFLLSRPGDPDHVTLDAPLSNERKGKNSAFVRRPRYTSIHNLRHASSVWDLGT